MRCSRTSPQRSTRTQKAIVTDVQRRSPTQSLCLSDRRATGDPEHMLPGRLEQELTKDSSYVLRFFNAPRGLTHTKEGGTKLPTSLPTLTNLRQQTGFQA
ncbi:hypothetical protein ElyMa_003717800 [Elysia marginata]|uniref:Uncharacterized protein n=1 Tax=Elysia marginata TaxID=1093978 RepID=A0AAV4F3T8_9GAST|nr:hypothetical protein ElyMa_003717800 [Elysia marginata]